MLSDGLPGGFLISGILAEILISHLELEYILNTSKNKYVHNVIYRYRYVDDILFLYKGNKQVKKLHQHINTIHPKITEQNNIVNFLDLTITKIANKHKFKIYRKATTTITTIHNNYEQPTKYKYAGYCFMHNRLNNMPMDTNDYNNELNTLKYIAQNTSHKICQINILYYNKRVSQ